MEETGQKDKALRDLIEIMQFTENISTKIHGLTNEAEIFRTVKEEFAKSKKYTVSILLLTDDGTKLKFEETSSSLGRVKAGEKAIGPMSYKSFSFDLNKSSFFSQVIRQGKTIEADFIDAASELLPRPLANLISKTIGYEKRSGILTPLERRGKIIGMLVVDSTELAEHFIPSVRNLAKHISTAIELAKEHAERENTEEKLRENEERCKELTESIDSVFFAMDKDLRYTYWNKASEKLTGITAEDAIGKSLTEVFPDVKGTKAEQIYLDALATQRSQSFVNEYRLRDKDFTFEIDAYPTKDGLSVLVKDITERKQMEEALRESEDKYRTQFEEALDAIFVGDAETGIIIDCNRAASELVGRAKSELVGKHQRILHPLEEIEGEFSRTFKQHVKEKEGQVLEAQVITKGGEIKDVAIKANVIELRGKKLIQGIFRDITERKKAEEESVRLSSAVRMSTDSIVISDLDGKIIDVNEATMKMYGTDDKRDLTEKNSFDLIAPEEREKALAGMKEVLEKGGLKGREYHVLTKDGNGIPVEMSVSIMKDADGKPIGFVGISRDITERKRAEEALRESEERYRNLVELAPDAIVTLNMKGVITSCNSATLKLTGYSRDEIIGRHFTRLGYLQAKDIPKYLKIFSSILRGKMPPPTECSYTRRDGTAGWAETHMSFVEAGGRKVGIQVILMDITERKKAEEQIRIKDIAIASSINAIALADLEGNVTYANSSFLNMWGFDDIKEILGKPVVGFWQREGQALAILGRLHREEGWIGELTARRKDGSTFEVQLTANMVKDAAGRPVCLMGSFIDITERKQMEEALAHERDLLHTLMDNIPDAIYFKDIESRFTRTNKAHAQIIGVSDPREAMAKTDFDFYADEFAREAYADEQEIVKTGRPMISKVEKVRRPDGHFKWVSATKVPIMDGMGRVTGLVGISRDITERMRMEEELKRYSEHLEELVEERTKKLREAERLAAIGETAAMVGHDLRNPLQVMSNLLYLARNRLKEFPLHINETAEQSGTNEIFGDMAKQIEYMNKIVSDLQDYARPLKPELAPTSLRQIINETLSTLPVPETIKVSIRIPEDLPNLMIDPSFMKRVFTNLITNALQAMADRGQLTMEASRTREATLISVHDTGVGIPEENLDKLFQPLFTTKSKGQGFGLAVCGRMVEAHGGNIMVKSQLGKGSTFTVEIPIGKEVS